MKWCHPCSLPGAAFLSGAGSLPAGLRQWRRGGKGAGNWGEGGAGNYHKYHRKERKGRKDGSVDFINSVVLKSGDALK